MFRKDCRSALGGACSPQFIQLICARTTIFVASWSCRTLSSHESQISLKGLSRKFLVCCSLECEGFRMGKKAKWWKWQFLSVAQCEYRPRRIYTRVLSVDCRLHSFDKYLWVKTFAGTSSFCHDPIKWLESQSLKWFPCANMSSPTWITTRNTCVCASLLPDMVGIKTANVILFFLLHQLHRKVCWWREQVCC